MLLEGLHLPLTTPFHPDGRLNPGKLASNVERYSKTPAAGLIALAETGEPSMLSDEEMRLVLRSVAGAAAEEKVLAAGVSQDSVRSTLDLAEAAAQLQFDLAVVGASPAARTLPELRVYFQTVADRSALPVVLSSTARRPIPVDVVVELAAHPRVLGLVDGVEGGAHPGALLGTLRDRTSSVKRSVSVTQVFAAVTGRMAGRTSGAGVVSPDALAGGGSGVAVASPVRTRTKAVGFQILAGTTSGLLDGLRGGAVGAAPAFAACAPQACYEVLAAWKDGDQGLADEKQERLREVARRVEEEMGVAGLKYGCDLNGYYGGLARLPLLPLTGSERSEVEALMHWIRN